MDNPSRDGPGARLPRQVQTVMLFSAVLLQSVAAPFSAAAPKRSRLDSAFLAAAAKNDCRAALALLMRGADIDARNAYHETALIIAARQDYPALADALLARGANLHLRDQTDQSALTLAGINGDVRMVAALLRRGAKAGSQDGVIALDQAAQHGNLALVRLLLDHGARLDDSAGDQPAFIEAAASGQTAVVRFLLSRGANVNGRSQGATTALMRAADSGNAETVRVLLEKGALPNLKDRFGSTALKEAAIFGRTDVMRLLLAAGADPNLPDEEGSTPLTYSLTTDSVEAVKLLLDHGVNPNGLARSVQTPLMMCAAWGCDDVAQLLLQRGADATARDGVGHTALIMLAQGGADLRVLFAAHPHDDPPPTAGQLAQMRRLAAQSDGDLVRALVAKGAECRGSEGANALLLAAAAGNAAVVRALAEEGAQVDARSGEDLARLWSFPRFGNLEPGFADLLGGHADPTRMTPLMYAARDDQLAAVHALLEKGASVDLQDSTGMNALLYAARNGHASTVEALLERGASVQTSNQDGKTALMLVAGRGAVGALEAWPPFPVMAGRSPRAKSFAEQRRAEYARRRKAAVRTADEADRAIVRSLLARGADIGARDRAGETALGCAIRAHHSAILPLLKPTIDPRKSR